VERIKLPFNRKKPLTEPDSGRVAIRLNQLGFERTETEGTTSTITPDQGYLPRKRNTR